MNHLTQHLLTAKIVLLAWVSICPLVLFAQQPGSSQPPVIQSRGIRLMVHPTDNAHNVVWGPRTLKKTYATNLKNGRENTKDIVNTYGDALDGRYAARICDQLTAFGYSDWYLPSAEELNFVFQNKEDVGGFSSTRYWSSSDNSWAAGNPMVQDFISGEQRRINYGNTAAVRCVREHYHEGPPAIYPGPPQNVGDYVAVARYRINDDGAAGLVFAAKAIGLFTGIAFADNLLSFAAEALQSHVTELGIKHILSAGMTFDRKPSYVTICFPANSAERAINIDDLLFLMEFDQSIPLGVPGTIYYEPRLADEGGPALGIPDHFVPHSVPNEDSYPLYSVSDAGRVTRTTLIPKRTFQTVGVVSMFLEHQNKPMMILKEYSAYNLGFASGTMLHFTAIRIPEGMSTVPAPGSVVRIFGETKNISAASHAPRIWVEKIGKSKYIEPHRMEVLSGSYLMKEDVPQGESIFSLYSDHQVYQAVVVSFTQEEEGRGAVSGFVLDAVTDDPLEGVVIRASREQTEVVSGTTERDGTYRMFLPAGDGYTLDFRKNGYLPVRYEDIAASEDEATYLEAVMQIDENLSGYGNIRGVVIDGYNGEGVPEATLMLREGVNAKTGSSRQQITTDHNGVYFIDGLLAGNYTVEATKEGYIPSFTTVVCIGNDTKDNQQIILSSRLAGEELRVILDWGQSPYDLDSHLSGPVIEGDGRFHVYYRQKKYTHGNRTHASLDLDVTTSYGPETITLSIRGQGVSRYNVHDFTNRTSSTSTALSRSNARVRVFRGSELVRSFHVPANTAGTLWTVFELRDNEIIPVNQMGFHTQPSTIR